MLHEKNNNKEHQIKHAKFYSIFKREKIVKWYMKLRRLLTKSIFYVFTAIFSILHSSIDFDKWQLKLIETF